ncbi:MAG: type II toxin-antitoxin system RelE/ParE family toxin [Verrucomicrobiota bacterium]
MSWGFEFEPGALRDLKKLGPSAATKIRAYLEKRIKNSRDPRAFGKPLRGDLHGLWRYRVEDYRLLARIEDHRLIVTVVTIGHRRDVYE